MRDKERASENLHFSPDSNYFQIWAYPCPFCGFSKPENAPNNSDPTKLHDQACMACHSMQSFFQEDDFTFYSGSEFTEQDPRAMENPKWVSEKNQRVRSQARAWGGLWEQSNR